MTPASETAVCIVNNGPRERRRRMRFGVVLLVTGAGLAALLVGIDAHRLWRRSLRRRRRPAAARRRSPLTDKYDIEVSLTN